MPRAVTTALVCVIQAGVLVAAGFPTASAEPTDLPPEVPADPSRTVFVDDPQILNPHATHVESWSRSGEGLMVNFASGAPDCFGVHVQVRETPEEVTVDLSGGMPPRSIGRMCIALAVPGSVAVPLQGPLGHRRVVAVAHGLDKPS
ncbi:hypothetical protein ACWDUN_28480 [Mycobacterium sp. NPDC003323]